VLRLGRSSNRLDNPFRLVSVTSSSRNEAVDVLSQLAQRLVVSQPLSTALSRPASRTVQELETDSLRRPSSPEIQESHTTAASKVVLRKKNRCGEFKCERDCDRECPNCSITDTDTVCSACGTRSYCKSYFGRDVDSKPLRDTWRYSSYGCHGADCTTECPECDASLGMVPALSVCLRCGTCANCKSYFGEDAG
jgi:hypothetical protein